MSVTLPEIVDLSLTLASELPSSWPGAVPFRHFVDHWFEEQQDASSIRLCGNGGPYRSHLILLDEHTGTHFDAPAHFIPPSDSGLPAESGMGDITGEKVLLAALRGRSRVLDLRAVELAGGGTSARVDVAWIRDWEAEHGTLGAGDVVLLLTGWDRKYGPGEAGNAYLYNPLVLRSEPAWPALSPDAVEYIETTGVRCIGTDAPSMGPADDGAPTHVAGMSRGMVFVECLTNLDLIQHAESVFMFAPVKIARSAGGPGRAFAFLEQENPA